MGFTKHTWRDLLRPAVAPGGIRVSIIPVLLGYVFKMFLPSVRATLNGLHRDTGNAREFLNWSFRARLIYWRLPILDLPNFEG